MKQLVPIALFALLTNCNQANSTKETPLTRKQQETLAEIKLKIPATDYFKVIDWQVDTLKTVLSTGERPVQHRISIDYKNQYGVILKRVGYVVYNQKDSVISTSLYDR